MTYTGIIRNKTLKWVLIAGGLAALVTVYLVFDPAHSIWFPKCPLLMLTGLECPGCGSQRAVHDLLHLDIVGALGHNLLMVVAIPYIITAFIIDIQNHPGPGTLRLRKILFGRNAILIAFAVIMLFWVLRNLPFFDKWI